MKTATFEYTNRFFADSSFVKAVYYNKKNYTLAIEFEDYTYGTPTAFYGAVPEHIYADMVEAESTGSFYNETIKPGYPNLSNGTVYNVSYEYVGEPQNSQDQKVAAPKQMTYRVKGYIRHTDNFTAGSLEEARELFLDSLKEEGYDGSDLAVTEVYILESGS
jgi:KTSC domain